MWRLFLKGAAKGVAVEVLSRRCAATRPRARKPPPASRRASRRRRRSSADEAKSIPTTLVFNCNQKGFGFPLIFKKSKAHHQIETTFIDLIGPILSLSFPQRGANGIATDMPTINTNMASVVVSPTVSVAKSIAITDAVCIAR